MKTAMCCLSLVLGLAFASGEPLPPDPHEDPLAQSLFPPELVMQNQQEIGLQDAQRASIQDEIHKAQSFFLDHQWKLSGEVEKLKKLVDAAPIEEARALEQVDRVLAAEREIKREQLTLLIRIKNVLTDRQRQRLAELRQRGGPTLPGR
jgi:Spy/CpxP family protein refolding chaperone